MPVSLCVGVRVYTHFTVLRYASHVMHHDMMRCDDEEEELHRVVSSAPWRALFMVPAYQGQPPCAACVGGEGAEVVQ